MRVSLFDQRHLGSSHMFSHSGLAGSYYITGDPNGEPLIILHGLTGNHIGMLPLSAHLSRYKCILVVLPGHGRSPIPPSELGLDELADWFLAFTKQWQNPFVVTHSYGGSLSMMAFAKDPAAIRALIMMNPVAETSLLTQGYRHFSELLRPTLTAVLNDFSLLRRRRHEYLLQRWTPQVTDVMSQLFEAESGLHTSPEQAAYFQKIARHFDNPKIFKSIPPELAAKTYCIVASRDPLPSRGNTKLLRKLFGSRHVRTCRNSGHLMPIEAFDDTARIINKILKRVTGPAPTVKRRVALRPQA